MTVNKRAEELDNKRMTARVGQEDGSILGLGYDDDRTTSMRTIKYWQEDDRKLYIKTAHQSGP